MRLALGVALSTVSFTFIVAAFLRIRGERTFLLLSGNFLAFVGDPLGVQWAAFEEVERIECSTGTGGASGPTAQGKPTGR